MNPWTNKHHSPVIKITRIDLICCSVYISDLLALQLNVVKHSDGIIAGALQTPFPVSKESLLHHCYDLNFLKNSPSYVRIDLMVISLTLENLWSSHLTVLGS